ncbi:MAG: hypothetical protein ABGY41_16940 [Candidatus Poribacteria bacterium]
MRDKASSAPTDRVPARVGGWPLLRTVIVICTVIAVGGVAGYKLETRLRAPLDDAWAGNPNIVAGKTYSAPDGSRIITKGDPFLAAADRAGADRSHVEQLRDARYDSVRIISHEVFADLPDALRWAAVCVITAGYGDRMPCKKLRFLVFMGFYTVFLPPC